MAADRQTENASDQKNCDNNIGKNKMDINDSEIKCNPNCKIEKFWAMKYERLQNDYDHLQKINQTLEDKLLNVVETFERKREQLEANIEHEKSTLMADVNKLSNKLVDARIKLHDYEEKEMLHAAECDSPCHRGCLPLNKTNKNNINGINLQQQHPEQPQIVDDPNLV